jgi:TonB family protein
MKAIIPIVFCLSGIVALSRIATAANAGDTEGCTDVKLLPRLEGCVIQECSARQHDSFEAAGTDTTDGSAAPLDANINALTYSCPASMDLQRVKRELDVEIRKAGFQNVAEDKIDAANTVVTARKGSHWIRWDASSEDGVISYSFTIAETTTEKFKAEACAGPRVLSLEKTCEIVECTSKSEYSAGMRVAQKEQTSVAGTVQTATLACPVIGPAQVLLAAEGELRRSGFEILFSDRERPESGWLTGRSGKHWVELVSGPDGESTSYALTSVAASDVVASTQVAPVQANENATPVVEVIAPSVAPSFAPSIEPTAPVPATPPLPPPPAASVPARPASASAPLFIPPRLVVQVPIQSSHDLIWSISGTVVINLLVDVNEDGTVTNARLTGRITKDVLKLESAALQAVSHWRFEPARQDGQMVPALKIPVQIHFQGRPWRY